MCKNNIGLQCMICPVCSYIGLPQEMPLNLLSNNPKTIFVCPRCLGGGNEKNMNPDISNLISTNQMIELNSTRGKEIISLKNIKKSDIEPSVENAKIKKNKDIDFGIKIQKIILTFMWILITYYCIWKIQSGIDLTILLAMMSLGIISYRTIKNIKEFKKRKESLRGDKSIEIGG